MSRKLSEKEYKKTLSYKLMEWLDGTKDPYLDNVEMKEQKMPEISEEVLKAREEEKRKRLEKIYNISENKEVNMMKKLYNVFCVLFCTFLVVMLLFAVSNLPSYGEQENPVNNEVSKRYIESGLQETGAINIVTGMILDYRAFDTLGESHVLFVATCTVLILLRHGKKKNENGDEDETDRQFEPENDLVLQMVAKILIPPIIIFGIYVILCGHLGPGGGFSGGAIIGAGLILYLNAFGFKKTEKFFTEKTYKIMSVSALGCYCIAKSYSFFTGANHIESIIPLGTPGAILSSGLILILNICVGVVVAGTMYTFYVMFRKGGY